MPATGAPQEGNQAQPTATSATDRGHQVVMWQSLGQLCRRAVPLTHPSTPRSLQCRQPRLPRQLPTLPRKAGQKAQEKEKSFFFQLQSIR